jgi:sporulation protein YlmC with PRC-barrel domain
MKFKTAASIAALAFAGALSLPNAVQAEFPTERSPGAVGDQKPLPAQDHAGAGYPQQRATPPEGQTQGAQPHQKAQGQGSWSDLAQQHADHSAAGQGADEDQKHATAIPAKQSDMVLGSSLLNKSVYGSDDATIGEVEEILFKSDGKIEGLVLGVGGFLGLGEKYVALPMDRFKVMPEADGQARITVSATEDELRNAPEFNNADRSW